MPHQVFEERRQLFGENGEFEEGGADLGVLSAHTVVSELLHGLDVLLLVVHMSCNTHRNPSMSNKSSSVSFIFRGADMKELSV